MTSKRRNALVGRPVEPLDARAARVAALDALARRDYASEDLRLKLIEKGYDASVVSPLLDALRDGPADKGVIPVRPTLQTEIKFFGRHKGGAIRHGPEIALLDQLWSCDCDDVVEAFDTADIDRRELPAV